MPWGRFRYRCVPAGIFWKLHGNPFTILNVAINTNPENRKKSVPEGYNNSNSIKWTQYTVKHVLKRRLYQDPSGNIPPTPNAPINAISFTSNQNTTGRYLTWVNMSKLQTFDLHSICVIKWYMHIDHRKINATRPAPSSPVAPEVVITTTPSATSDDKTQAGTATILESQWY